MSANPLASKTAAPYARALFDYSVKKNLMHQVTADFQNLDIFFTECDESSEFTEYLDNPIFSQAAKRDLVKKTFQSEINPATFKFLMILVDRGRINLLRSVMYHYLELIYETASIKTIEVVTAFAFTDLQTDMLTQKLKELTHSRAIRLRTSVDSSLIGGFLIKTESKVIDFTIKNKLQKLAKHLDTVLEI